MKIREVIQEFIPCEVCGNRDIHKFYFHVYVHKGSQPFVKCCECDEEYYSMKARKVLTKVNDDFRIKKCSESSLKVDDHKHPEFSHPLLKTLAGF